jgi:Flp pilus assembly pilin Flp
MRRFLHRLRRDQSGTTTIEFTIVMVLFLMLTFGIVEFGYLLWQYNSAAKAAQLGARMAAVSDPVWGELVNLEDTGAPGAAWETDYTVTCTSTSDDGGSGDCDGTVTGDYEATAMQCLVFGRSAATPPCDTECAETGIDGENGLCDRYSFIKPENVSITYSHTGLGFAGRPGGPVPTVTLQLTGLTFDFFALGPLLEFEQIEMPDFKVTMTGEDLSRLAP